MTTTTTVAPRGLRAGSLAGLATLALMLSACGNLPGRDDLSGPPGATYSTSKSPTAYAQCLTPKWRNIAVVGGSATVDSVPVAGGGLRLTLKVSGGVARVVEVVPEGAGSTIRYWNRSVDMGSGTPESARVITECR